MVGWESARSFDWLAHWKACGSICDTGSWLHIVFCVCGSGCSHVFWVGRCLYDPPPMQHSAWTVISSLRDLDRWLVYSVCSGCLARWTLDYTCSSAVFDFGKGRESPQHARRSLWRVIFGGFLTSNDCERSEQMNVESVERTYIYLLNTWTQYPERFYASCIRSVYRAVSMHGEVSQLPAIYIFSDIVDSNSAIILTSLRHQSSWLRFVTNQSTVSAIPILKSVDCI